MEELNLKIERYEGPLDLLLALIALVTFSDVRKLFT